MRPDDRPRGTCRPRADFGDDLLRRVGAEAGNLCQTDHGIFMRYQRLGCHLVEPGGLFGQDLIAIQI
jgi:hypothetical protein